jgi:hypothetical protein
MWVGAGWTSSSSQSTRVVTELHLYKYNIGFHFINLFLVLKLKVLLQTEERQSASKAAVPQRNVLTTPNMFNLLHDNGLPIQIHMNPLRNKGPISSLHPGLHHIVVFEQDTIRCYFH